MKPANDTVAWFQIGTSDSAAAQQFYGDLFGWTFREDPGSGPGYQLVGYPEQPAPVGGITPVDQGEPRYAAFCVQVADVEQTCTRAAELGGKVVQSAQRTPRGLLSAHLLDADGNRFVVFTPAPQ